MANLANGTSIAHQLESFARERRLANPVYVTRPSLPSLDDFDVMLRDIWSRQWLTNRGVYHAQLEEKLGERFEAEHVSLSCNGTIALLVALRALGIESGEIITTPFTFPATVHAIEWSGHRPVFCDIDAETLNLDAGKLESLIGPETRAILPVHVFGRVCDVAAIDAIAKRHGLSVVYDAAHAFGVRVEGRSVTDFGDMSVFSFHATKTYSTIEGGALVSSSAAMKAHVDLLENFGIADKEAVLCAGINGKLNEVQAAFGLLQLEAFDEGVAKRKALVDVYREGLKLVSGIRCLEDQSGVELNYGYAAILVDASAFGLSRDALYDLMLAANMHPRKYFYPLCSHFPPYEMLPSARAENLPVAERVAEEVLCLPLYAELDVSTAEAIAEFIVGLHARAKEQE